MVPKPRKRLAGKAEIERRRAEVATLLKGGASQREIASALGVSLGTVNSDVKALREEWAERRADGEMMFSLQLARLEDMWTAINESVLRGHLPSVETGLKIVDRIIRLLGLDAAQRLNEQMYADWRSEAVRIIRDNGIPYTQVAQELGSDLARQLFTAAGIPTVGDGEAEATGTEGS